MNKEQQELLGDAYKNYLIEDAKVLPNMSKEKMTEMGLRLTQEEFINKCKTEDALSLKWREEYRNLQYGSKEEIEHLSKHYTSDTEFSERWGLKIEERELSRDERIDLYCKEYTGGVKGKYEPPFDDFIDSKLTTRNIPNKLITITYNDKKIESYE
jgi:hypothetical protein